LVFEELVSGKTFIETYNFLRSHATRHCQKKKEKDARHIHSIYLPSSATKRDKFKKFLAFINELHIQDSEVSDEEVDGIRTSKTAMVSYGKTRGQNEKIRRIIFERKIKRAKKITGF
jgi:hypothetical protein